MIIETKYNIGDTVHQVYTSPADAEMEQYQDEHYYYGGRRIKSMSVTVGNVCMDNNVSICYHLIERRTNETTGTTPCYEEDAFPTKEAAMAEVERREKQRWEPE